MNRVHQFAFASALFVSSLAAAQGDGKSFTLLDHKTLTTTEKLVKGSDKKGSGVLLKDHKSLQFKKLDPMIVVYTGPEDDMLSYRIQGKRNPTLVVKPGAVLHILFANTDDDMFHDMRFGSSQPPFDLNPSKDGTAGTETLPHATETGVSADSITIKAPTTPGTYTYFCSMKGHAKGGMYGQVIVR